MCLFTLTSRSAVMRWWWWSSGEEWILLSISPRNEDSTQGSWCLCISTVDWLLIAWHCCKMKGWRWGWRCASGHNASGETAGNSPAISIMTTAGPPPKDVAPARRSSQRFQVSDFMWGSTLGEGSYARVIHAQLKANQAHYAIKVMEKRHIRKENKIKQVIMEKNILSKISHEFVIKLWFTFQVNFNPIPQLLSYITCV